MTLPTEGPSPWHRGEKLLQERVGMAERMEVFGRKMIHRSMPDQHCEFYEQLPFLLYGTVDDEGRPWAGILEGVPGFARAPDAQHLRIDVNPDVNDPAAKCLKHDAAIGLLGIDLQSRRRNRLNGKISQRHDKGFSIFVEHAFGNCPQYIQERACEFNHAKTSMPAGTVGYRDGLDTAARAVIANADTFFVASYMQHDNGQRAIDVSHRGGKAGFIKIEGDCLTIPDFAGNKHFNTLGNLLLNPRAGLLFVDFNTGDVLQLSGSTELILDGPLISEFKGAERLWVFKVERLVRRPAAVTLRWIFKSYSPYSLKTGSWSEIEMRPPLPPFTRETAIQKVRMAEDAWNSRDPERVALAYTVDSRWRNRNEFLTGREQIQHFLEHKWQREQEYRLIKELWAYADNRIAVRFAYEWHDEHGQWFRSYGNENWEFDQHGLMQLRYASINDLAIEAGARKFHWPQGRRPDDHPSLSECGL